MRAGAVPVFHSAPDKGAQLCDERVCLSVCVGVCLSAIISSELHVLDFHQFFVHGYKLCAVIPVAGQWTHWTTLRALKVTSQVATPGAEFAVYDCLIWYLLFRLQNSAGK